jgi:hypothetical protein
LKYEFALSAYFIFKAEWGQSNFFNVPLGVDNKATYSSFTFAQDLVVLKNILPLIGSVFGLDTEGKNFIYYKVFSGKQPPAFQDVHEQSIGLGIYL